MPATIFAQAVASPILGEWLWVLAVIVLGGLLYKTFVDKKSGPEMLALLTSIKMAVPVLILVFLALATTDLMGLFGPLASVVGMIFEVLIVILVPIVLIAMIAWPYALITGKYKQ